MGRAKVKTHCEIMGVETRQTAKYVTWFSLVPRLSLSFSTEVVQSNKVHSYKAVDTMKPI